MPAVQTFRQLELLWNTIHPQVLGCELKPSFKFQWPSELLTRATKNGSLISSNHVYVCFLFFLSLLPSVSNQPVSTTRTNVNLTSKQPLSPQLYQAEGAYLWEQQHPLLPPWRATCQQSHFLPVPQMSPDAALSLKCSNNTLSHEPTCASSRETEMEEMRLVVTFFPKPAIYLNYDGRVCAWD